MRGLIGEYNLRLIGSVGFYKIFQDLNVFSICNLLKRPFKHGWSTISQISTKRTSIARLKSWKTKCPNLCLWKSMFYRLGHVQTCDGIKQGNRIQTPSLLFKKPA